MSDYTVRFKVAEDGPFEAKVEVEEQYFDSIFDAEGNLVTPGHNEPEDAAVERSLKEAVEVIDFDKAKLTHATLEVEFTIKGTVQLEIDEEDLVDFETQEDLEYSAGESFEEVIERAIEDEVASNGWNVDLDWSIIGVVAE